MSWTRAMISRGRRTARLGDELRSVTWRMPEKHTELAAQKEYAERIIDAVRDPVLVLDSDLVVRRANRAFFEAFDVEPQETIGRILFDLGNGRWENPALRRSLEDILRRNGRFEDFVMEQFSPEAGRRILQLNAQRIDHLHYILLTIEDVTERREAQKRQEMLVAELNHRVKNMLATVQAILTQTARQASSLEQLEESLLGRLKALSRGHEVLVNAGWQRSNLADLIEEALRSYVGSEHISIDCDAIPLRPRAALAFNLILHELATNAARFGALSVNSGRVHIECRLPSTQSEWAEFSWSESGGPPIVSESIQRGFGATLIERSAEHELFGTAELKFEPEGMRCLIQFTTDIIQASKKIGKGE